MMGPCFQAFPESCTLSLWVEAAGTEVVRCPGLPQFREGVVGWNVVILAVPQSPDGSRGESWLRVIEEDDQGPDAPGPLLPMPVGVVQCRAVLAGWLVWCFVP